MNLMIRITYYEFDLFHTLLEKIHFNYQCGEFTKATYQMVHNFYRDIPDNDRENPNTLYKIIISTYELYSILHLFNTIVVNGRDESGIGTGTYFVVCAYTRWFVKEISGTLSVINDYVWSFEIQSLVRSLIDERGV